jgi:hypothetical protein
MPKALLQNINALFGHGCNSDTKCRVESTGRIDVGIEQN